VVTDPDGVDLGSITATLVGGASVQMTLDGTVQNQFAATFDLAGAETGPLPFWVEALDRLGHPSTTKAGALSFALHTLWLLGTHLRSHRIVHVQNTDSPLLIGFLAKLLLCRRLCVTINSEPAALLGWNRPTGPLRFRLIRRLADMVGALSPEMQAALVALGMPDSRVELLPSGVDKTEFRPPSVLERQRARLELELQDDAVVYLFVGRLVALKKIDSLIRTWAELSPRVRRTLLVVGDGPERRRLERLVAQLELENVRLEPATEDVVKYLHAADVFVLPSEVEGLSSALLEAMTVGLPVIVSDLSSNRALVEHDENGLVFPVDDLAELKKALVRLVSSELRERLGQSARRTAEQYSLQTTARIHRRLYVDLSHQLT